MNFPVVQKLEMVPGLVVPHGGEVHLVHLQDLIFDLQLAALLCWTSWWMEDILVGLFFKYFVYICYIIVQVNLDKFATECT